MRVLLFLAALLWSGAAQACILNPDARPGRVADFAASAFDCLSTPPRGYAFEAGIEARGERRGEREGVTSYIYLRGPAVSLDNRP